MIDRAAIYRALYERFRVNLLDVTMLGRVPLHWADVTPSSQPALSLGPCSESADSSRGEVLTIWTLKARVLLYAHVQGDFRPWMGDRDASVSDQVLDMVGWVDAALEPDDFKSRECTLGGLVQYCRITETEYDVFAEGQQVVAMVTVEMSAVDLGMNRSGCTTNGRTSG